jgi:hypothetical protein
MELFTVFSVGSVFHACAVQMTESADGRNKPRPPTGIPSHFPNLWAVSGRQNLTYRSLQLSNEGFLVRQAPLRKYHCSLMFLSFVSTGLVPVMA